MNRVQLVGKSFNIEKENEKRPRERGSKPACHHFPAEVSFSSSFPPGYVSQSSNYEEERRNKLRGRKKEFPTEVTAFMSPCLNQMANLSFF